MTVDTEEIWLTSEQQQAWRSYLLGTTLLMDRLDRDLRHQHDLSLAEYEILVRLSERTDHRMRMAELADALRHSRSRVTHTVRRLELDGLTRRDTCLSDGRGVEAVLTDEGMRRLVEAAPTHVAGVRAHFVDVVPEEDFAAIGRAFDAVSNRLLPLNPAAELR